MRHDPASGAIVIMLRSLKMHGMAQAVTDLIEQGAPAFDAAVPILSQLLKAEMAEREIAALPPYGRLAAIILSSENAAAVDRVAADLAQAIPNAERLEVYGPADAPLALVRGRRRKRLLVRADRDVDVQAFLRAWLGRVKVPGSVRLTVDVDPYSFL